MDDTDLKRDDTTKLEDVRFRGINELPPEQQNIFCLANASQQIMVTIKGDGRCEFGPGFTTNDEAAKLFWECIGTQYIAAFQSLNELVSFIENHKALKNTDPVAALESAKRILGRK